MMQDPEESKKNVTAENENISQESGKQKNWITDMYDKMNIPVKALDAMLLVLLAIIVFFFIFGNKIQLGF